MKTIPERSALNLVNFESIFRSLPSRQCWLKALQKSLLSKILQRIFALQYAELVKDYKIRHQTYYGNLKGELKQRPVAYPREPSPDN